MTVGEFCCIYFLLWLQLPVILAHSSLNYEGAGSARTGTVARLVKKEERTPLLSTEFGAVSAVDIDDGTGMHNYHLQFITLEPNSLFLPVLLHADMVFYVHTGSGRLSWIDGDDVNKISLQRGDVYRLRSGTLFYLHSGLESERPRLRVIAIFANPDEDRLEGPSIGPYSSINDLIRGFDKQVLQAAFQVSVEVIEELTSITDTPAIVHADLDGKKQFWEENILQFINAFVGIHRFNTLETDNKKKRTKTFNFFKEDPDFENCNGWSKVVTRHDLHALKGSNIGIFMVNLTKGSMMGPHWNPTAAEVSVVLEGEGMVRVVCPSALTNKDCKNTRVRAEEGDVFTVPRFHPMAQTSFNNGSLVFMGFSTASKRNHPQFLAGKASVFQTLDKAILGASFNVSNTTIDQLLAAQDESIILECTSCAEEQEMLMEEEIEERQKEEERKREEEEARRREEEEKRRKEEEHKRQEEERRRQEEEERRRQEEEEERKRQEQEEQRRRREEEERKRQQEEQKRRREEEERKRQQEEQKRRREEEERQREEEERKRQKEEQRRQEERQREEEERKRQEEEQRRQEEQSRQEEEEEERQREEEEQRRQEEEQRQEEQERRQEQEEQRRQQEEEEQRQQEAEEQRRKEERQEEEWEEERRRQEEEQRRQEEEEQKEEEARRWEEEQERQGEKRQGEEEPEGERARREEEERIERERRQRQEEQRRKEERREEWEEERRRQEEESRRQEEEEQKVEEARQHEEERRWEEEQGRQGERGQGEEESEGERARREEEERVERERQQEESRRGWGYIKLKTNRQLPKQTLRWTRSGKNKQYPTKQKD